MAERFWRVRVSVTMKPIAKKKKQPPFTEAELYILVTEVTKRKAVIVVTTKMMGVLISTEIK